jgi:hypothetical protein
MIEFNFSVCVCPLVLCQEVPFHFDEKVAAFELYMQYNLQCEYNRSRFDCIQAFLLLVHQHSTALIMLQDNLTYP